MNAHLQTAVAAVREAGELLRRKAGADLVVNEAVEHDIKLELDVECQNLLTGHFERATPGFAILGEEGRHGGADSEHRWIIDPIDGTVNFFYGLPHYCITVALQRNMGRGYETLVGVTFDPVRGEMFTAARGEGAQLNGRPIRVSGRSRIGDAVMAIGFSKTNETARAGMENFEKYTLRARKLRVLGAAALDLAYVASGRIDLYCEIVRIWDIAAGLLLVTEAGGRVATHPADPSNPHLFSTLAFNGALPFILREGKLIEL